MEDFRFEWDGTSHTVDIAIGIAPVVDGAGNPDELLSRADAACQIAKAAGRHLGLESSVVDRQPFPGPGLAVRCLGALTAERLAVLGGGIRLVAQGDAVGAGVDQGFHG